MANIKTPTLTAATETAIAIPGTHCIITNRTGAALYASANAGITADADGVKYIADGASDMVVDTNGTVHLLSSTGGKVQIEGTDIANRNFKVAGGSGSALSADGTTISNNSGVLSANYIGAQQLGNPDFKINQRGAAVYTASGTSYCVDGWRTYKTASLVGNFTATPTATGLTLDNQSNGACAISQIIEQFADLFEKTVTLSVCVDDVVYHTTATPTNITGAYGQLTTSFGLMQIYVTADTRVSIDVYVNAGKQCVVNWAKLEYGSAATPFAPPNRAEELAKCQRYYQIRSTNDIAAVDLRPTMRATPTDIVAVTGGYAYVAEL